MFSFNDPKSIGDDWAFAEGRAIHPELKTNMVDMNELMGLDFRFYEHGIWSWKPGNSSITFMVFQGPIEGQQATDKLKGLGFRETIYRDTTYFELDEDFSFDVRHQLRRTGLLFNRLALLENSIIAAPATEIIERLIAARQTDSRTLMDSVPHSSLVRAAGEGLVSGAFFGPRWIVESWNSVNPKPPEQLDRYRAGPEAWETLSDYSLALLGYRIRENRDEMVIALNYRTPTKYQGRFTGNGNALEQLHLRSVRAVL